VTDDSFKSYAWDPYNKPLSVSSTACGTNGECATYDAFGRMVESSKDSTYTENWYTQAGTVLMSGTTLAHAYLRSPGGGTFLEYGSATDYLHKDWLGNARIASLISGQTVGAGQAYAPYGEVYNFIAGAGGDWMFTGDTTQLVSEYLFDTPNREFASSNQGRWLSPDPAGQGWNQYAYSTNPNSAIDPSGLASTNNVSIWQPALDLGGGLDWAAFGLDGGFGGADSGSPTSAPTTNSPLSTNTSGAPGLCLCPNDLTSGATLASTFDMGTAALNTVSTILGWLQSGLQAVANSGAGCGDGTLNCYAGAGALFSASSAASGLVSITTETSEGTNFTGFVGSLSDPLEDSYVVGLNAPETIDGVDYSGHALDTMQQYGIPTSVIQDALTNGAIDFGNQPLTFTSTTPNIIVVTNAAGGVITVIPQ
jgi:RHS repeat-associated protein